MILDSRGTRAHARLAYHSRLALTHDLRHLSSIYPVGVRQHGVEFATFYYPGLIKCALRRFDIDPRTDWRCYAWKACGPHENWPFQAAQAKDRQGWGETDGFIGLES